MEKIDPIAGITETLAWIEDALQASARPAGHRPGATSEHNRHLVEQGNILLRQGVRQSTMREWMKQHHQTSVDTLQIDVSGNHTAAPYGGWAPLDRTVDALARATAVCFDGSWREYAGMRVILSSPDAILVADNWHAILYVASAGVRP